MTDQPTPPANATQARAALDSLISSEEFGARVFRGDPAANKELRDLSTLASGASADGVGADVVAAVMNGTAGKPGQVAGMFTDGEHAQMAGVAELFREVGIRDQVISEFLSGKQVSREEFDATVNWKKVAMGSKDFVDRYMSGDTEAKQKMMLANSIITNGWYKEGAAA